jgi:hypothetical protein
MADIFYYSRHCEHSQKAIQFITKNNIIDKISSICIDNNVRDANNNQLLIILENGKKLVLPPSILTVPAILCVKKNYTVVLGTKNIIDYFESNKEYINIQQTESKILNDNVEPISYDFNNNSNTFISSENFTNYNSNTGKQMYNYTSVDNSSSPNFIYTPSDNYQSDKISDLTMDKMLEQRKTDISLPIPKL